MEHKWPTIIVIGATIICVMIMLFYNIDDKDIKKEDKLNVKSPIENVLVKKSNENSKKDVSYLKRYKIKNSNDMVTSINKKYNNLYSILKYKNNKYEKIYEQINQDKDNYYLAKHNIVKEVVANNNSNNDEYYTLRKFKINTSPVITGDNSSSENKTEESNNKNSKNYNDIKTQEIASAFKVNVYDIEESLTLSDKVKLLSAAIKLAPVDYARVEEYLKSSDGEEGVIEALKLLKARLDDKDYQKIRDVADKFLNMDIVENSD